MKVSIVIPNYNGARFLESCLMSLDKQTYKDFETIFVDNGSQDNSCEIVSRQYPEIRLIKLETNTGFSGAVNTGIRSAKGELVVLLNNDTEACEDWLESLVSTMESDKRIFSACSKMLQFHHRELIDDAGDEYNLLGWAYKRGDNANAQSYTQTGQVFSSCAGAAIYRKALFDEIGFFDEGFFAYMEDVDLCYRARIHGYKNVYCAKAMIFHVGSGTSGSKYNSFKVKLAARNNVYVVWKNMPFVQLALNSPFLLVGFLVKYAFFCKIGFRRDFEVGFLEGVRTRKNMNKVNYKSSHFRNYLAIEGRLIANTIKYVASKLMSKV